MQVHEVPSFEEFYGLINNEIDDDEFDVENKDEEIQNILLVALGLLQEFYLIHMYDNEYYILSDEFYDEITNFNILLKENLHLSFSKYFDKLQSDYNLQYDIPNGTVELKLDLENTLNSAVDSVTETLYTDLKAKADFYHEVAITTGMFSLHANFRRAIKRLSNVIDNNAQYSKHIIEREYLSFVYGQEALYYWRVSGRNTCPWCYEIEAMGAMPLSWFPVDHPNGHCWLEPANPDEYSDEYLQLSKW